MECTIFERKRYGSDCGDEKVQARYTGAWVRQNGRENVDDCYVVYSGVSDGRAKVGVAVLMTEDTSRFVKSWQCVNERIMVVKMKVGREWLALVQVYAPTDGSNVEEKERFYSDLQGVIDKLDRKETLGIMGDFNAQVGKDCKVWGSVIGRNGEELKNDSGSRLLRFCAVVLCCEWHTGDELLVST